MLDRVVEQARAIGRSLATHFRQRRHEVAGAGGRRLVAAHLSGIVGDRGADFSGPEVGAQFAPGLQPVKRLPLGKLPCGELRQQNVRVRRADG